MGLRMCKRGAWPKMPPHFFGTKPLAARGSRPGTAEDLLVGLGNHSRIETPYDHMRTDVAFGKNMQQADSFM